jgi:hypothetical protein
MIVAAPAQVVDIVSSAADDGQSDSIIVQLDPPELGRVSIDFKFDANGLQHVTITGESPEAMRQLRLMHFELIQALERHGIGSSNMTFQQQQQNTQQSPLPNPFAGEPVMGRPGTAEASVPVVPPYSLSSPRTLPGGRLDMNVATFSGAQPLLKTDKLRALAVTSKERHPRFTDVPTIAETLVPDYDVVSWLGFTSPAGLPPAIRDRLYEAFKQAMARPEVKAKLEELGNDTRVTSPAEFRARVEADMARWRPLAHVVSQS